MCRSLACLLALFLPVGLRAAEIALPPEKASPENWTDKGFAGFVKIVDFATARGCAFVSHTEYVAGRASAGFRNRP